MAKQGRADLHMHTSASDGWPSAKELVDHAKHLSLDVIAVTDHDTIEGSLELQRDHASERVPISVEWTVPFHGGFFHLGVHNLRLRFAPTLVAALSAYTQHPDVACLPDLLDTLQDDRDTLVGEHQRVLPR